MGDDPFNPIAAETYIKREPWWAVASRLALDALLAVVAVWLLAVFILSLEKAGL